ncbi:MAG: hypothetical protein ACI4NO_00390 [Oxalobacter sp.]
MEQDKINDIIGRLDVEGIKLEEINTFIMGMRKHLMEKGFLPISDKCPQKSL